MTLKSSSQLFLAILFLSNLLMAMSLEEASWLYERRGESLETALEAKEAYRTILTDSVELEDKILAFDRYARLAILSAEIGPKVFNEKMKNRKETFKQCRDLSAILHPDQVGQDLAEYYYWRATCLGLILAHEILPYKVRFGLTIAKEMQDLVAVGMKKFPEYDGGGFHRLKAAIYLRSKEVKLSGLYKPKKAVSLMKSAIELGPEYFINHLFLAESLLGLGEKEQAKELLSTEAENLERLILEDGFQTIPNGIENHAVLIMLRELIERIERS